MLVEPLLICFCVAEVTRPASVAGSEQASAAKKLGEWKADFEDAGSAVLSNASRGSQARKSKAGTAATTDTEVWDGMVL